MKAETKEEAFISWLQLTRKYAIECNIDIDPKKESGASAPSVIDLTLDILSKYQSALRAEIEKRADEQNYNGAHDFDDGQIYAYKEVLALLDTIKPPQE